MNYYSQRISIQESLTQIGSKLTTQFNKAEIVTFKPNQLFHHIEEYAPQLVICKLAAGKKLFDYVLSCSDEIDQAIVECSQKPGIILLGPPQDLERYSDLGFPHLFCEESDVLELIQRILELDSEDEDEFEQFFEELKAS